MERSYYSVNERLLGKDNASKSIAVTLVIMTVIIGLGSILIASDDAGGWVTRSYYGYSSMNGRPLGYYVYRYSYSSPYVYYKYSSTSYIYTGRAGTYDTYSACMGIDISTLDDRSNINTATLYTRISYNYGSHVINVYLLNGDPASMDAESLYYASTFSYFIGGFTCSGTGPYATSFSGDALNILRNRVKAGENCLWFHFYSYDSASEYAEIYPSSTYISLDVDDQPPSVPSPTALSSYTASTTVNVRWSGVSDLPSGGSTGGVQYRVGVFENSTSSTPMFTTDWRSGTNAYINDLADDGFYYFRVQSRDSNGFESAWSSEVHTRIDVSPPVAPVFIPEPEFTKGTSNRITWLPSSDKGSGIDYYGFVMDDDPAFLSPQVVGTMVNYYDLTGLTSGKTYYYLLFIEDKVGNSIISTNIVRSTQDDDPPTVPVTFREPSFTKGGENTFEWHPAIDGGVGLNGYLYQVSTTNDFSAGTVVKEGWVNATSITATGLADGTHYYFRVRSQDGFGHLSDWSRVESSVQDITGPGEIGVDPLMDSSPPGDLELRWEGSTDQGSGTGWYDVLWSQDPAFSTGVKRLDHVYGQSYTVRGLSIEGKWHFRVIPYDSLGNPGTAETVSTTIDGTAPTGPVITPLSDYTKGRTCTVSWSASTDARSGLDHYVLKIYLNADRSLMAFSAVSSGTTFMVPGLIDGTTYYYEVVAVDGAGNEAKSALLHSVQDSSGPSVPAVHPLDIEVGSEPPAISWDASLDEGIGGVEYRVEVASDRTFTSVLWASPWLEGTAEQLFGGTTRTTSAPEEGTYYARVIARDGLGTMSRPSPSVMFAIDLSAPPTPVLSGIPEHSGGGSVSVIVEPVEDPMGGPVEYQLVATDVASGDVVGTSLWSTSLEHTIRGLKGEGSCALTVVSRDHRGWVSEPSEAAFTVLDLTPPVVSLNEGGIFGPDDQTVTGTIKDLGSGPRSVEISMDGGATWKSCAVNGEGWNYPINSISSDVGAVLVRAMDQCGNMAPALVATIDREAPSAVITSPKEGDMLSGDVHVIGEVSDPNLESVTVEIRRKGMDEWTTLLSQQGASDLKGVLVTWSVSDLGAGEHILRLTAKDRAGSITTRSVNLTVGGAFLQIDPSLITFSNSHPAPGDEVKVQVTVQNMGGSDAEDVTVIIYDGDKEIGRTDGVTVPAYGSSVVSAKFKAGTSHDISARATSEIYDTGEMASGAPLEAAKEMFLEDVGGILGLVALLLSLLAILLALVLGTRKRGKVKAGAEKVEGSEPEKKVEASTSPTSGPAIPPAKPQPALSPATTRPQALPQASGQATGTVPSLPPPTTAPVSMPPPPAPPSAPPALRAAPQLPDPGITYMSPKK